MTTARFKVKSPTRRKRRLGHPRRRRRKKSARRRQSRKASGWLDGLEADFSFLFGAGFADPDYAAALWGGRLFVEDKFDDLATPNVESSAQPEAVFRGIEDEAWEPPGPAFQIDDQAGRPFGLHTFRAASSGGTGAGHFFIAGLSKGSDGVPEIVSCEVESDGPGSVCWTRRSARVCANG
jgi:hypothetical protein